MWIRPTSPVRRRLAWRGTLLVAAGAAAFTPLRECLADEPQVLSFDVTLAPVCLDGQFPLVIQAPGKRVDAVLKVSTDVTGKLRGQLLLDGLALSVTGTVKHAGGVAKINITAKTIGSKLTISGDLVDGTKILAGLCVGKGFLAPGANPFTLDLTAAKPQIATIECALDSDTKGRLKGTAHVLSCGADVPLSASGKTTGTELTLSVKKGKFKFLGNGTSGASGIVADWTASGFGASASGTGLLLVAVTPPSQLRYGTVPSAIETDYPISPLTPTNTIAPRITFSVSPTLPGGIAIDVATGVISGTVTEIRPSDTYTVTSANYAGSSTATLRFATRIPKARSLDPEVRFMNDEDIRHFLRRAEFGVRQTGGGTTNFDRVRTFGRTAYVEQILTLSQNGPAEAIASGLLPATSPTSAQVAAWWSSLMMNTDNPFQERLAFFWADRFAVSTDSLAPTESHLMKPYINLYRYQGNGNLRELLRQMSRSGAMLKFLDGAISTVDKPNENFAREFWELFTLGVDNGYTQADIVEASRAWTGWKLAKNATTNLIEPVFDPALHDSTQKTVLGQVIPGQSVNDDFDAVIDITLQNRQVAEFISKCLFEHFCYENPPQVLVDEMAAMLRQSNWELKPLLRAILNSEAMFSDKSRSCLVKGPVDYSIGFIHATGLAIPATTLAQQLAAMGQAPGQVPSVNGFPQGVLWFHAQNMSDRAAMLASCVDAVTAQRAAGIEVATILPPVANRSPGEVVDRVASLLGVVVSSEEKQRCVDYLNDPTPFDGSNQAMLDDRARGLLFILAQHPQNEIR
jgi:uncharacterized protein (DUF1800 family)